MDKESTVFDDIIQGLGEIEEYQKGNIQLRSHVTTTKEEVEIGQLLLHNELLQTPAV
jgi:hypothetical protein